MKGKSVLLTIIVAVTFGAIGIGLPIAAHFQGIGAGVIMKVVELVLSWPVAVFLVTLVFFTRFRNAIDYFLHNIGIMKLPGGVEIQSQTAMPEKSTEEQQQELAKFIIEDLQQEQLRGETEREQLQEQFRSALYESLQWRFRYLRIFLVYNTKRVLRWFAEAQAKSRAEFDILWSPTIPEERERDAILRALLENELLEENRNILRITELGYAFLQYIGLIPYPPASPPPGGIS